MIFVISAYMQIINLNGWGMQQNLDFFSNVRELSFD